MKVHATRPSLINRLAIKSLVTLALAVALCLFANVKTTHCQTMPNSIPTQNPETETERRAKLIEALERSQDEVKSARAYIPQLELQVKSKQSIIDAQMKRQTLADEAVASLQAEVVTLQSAIAEQKNSILIQKKEIEFLKNQLDKTNKKLSRSRKLNQFLIVGIAAAILATVLK